MVAYQSQMFQVAKCHTCKAGPEFFARWIDREHYIHDDHAGHRVATWLEVK